MLYFDADPRSNAVGGSNACGSCCCQPLNIRPGETNLMKINYAPWSLPFGAPGIVYGTSVDVEIDDTSCPETAPHNTAYSVNVPVTVQTAVSVASNATPVGDAFTYSVENAPENGTLTQATGTGTGTFEYTPTAGFEGFDYFDYRMTNGDGNFVIRTVVVSVGTHSDELRQNRVHDGELTVDLSRITIDRTMQTIEFPVRLSQYVDMCRSYRVTIKQPAKNCNRNLFEHIMCFDVHPNEC